MEFKIEFSGHQNILSNHKKTIEITKESHLTTQGDCIIGVNASASCADLPQKLKDMLKNPDSKIECVISVKDDTFTILGRGHEQLTLTHKNDIVIRKSAFVCPRTLAVKCDKASDLLPRNMVAALQDPSAKGTFTIRVE